jgi:hypothetical protein
MMKGVLEAAALDDLAASVGFSVKEANKTGVAAMLSSVRENVMQRADLLLSESPPALFFDPR